MQLTRITSITSVCVAIVLATLVSVLPAGADTFSTWTPGPDATQDNTYSGFIDLPQMNATVPTGSFTVAGWFVDSTAQGWAGADDIQVWQGTMDGGGKMLARATFPTNRPDVADATGNPFWAAAGFSADVPGGSLSTGSQVLSVYAHTPAKGWWYKQVQVNVSASAAPASSGQAAPAPAVSGGAFPIVGIELPKEGEQVKTKNDYTIIGYALDVNATPNQGVAGTGIDRVQVYLGERDAGGTLLGEADLGISDSIAPEKYGSQFASAGWRVSFKPTKFKANGYTINAYARSVVTGKEDVGSRYFAIKEST